MDNKSAPSPRSRIVDFDLEYLAIEFVEELEKENKTKIYHSINTKEIRHNWSRKTTHRVIAVYNKNHPLY